MQLIDINWEETKYDWAFEIQDSYASPKVRRGQSILSPVHASEFSKQGACVVRNLISNDLIQECWEALTYFEKTNYSLPKNRPTNSKSFPGLYFRDVHKSSQVFHKILRLNALSGTIRHLIGPRIRLRAFSARVTSDLSKTKWHRDQRSYVNPRPVLFSPPADISVLIYLSNADKNRGLFEFLPGSHLSPKELPEESIYHDLSESIGVCCDPGDAIIAHSSLLHRATQGLMIDSTIKRGLLILHFGPAYYVPQEYIDIKTNHSEQNLIERAQMSNDYELEELLTYTGHM